ncbi:MAG: DUF2304 family protein [Candidatus Undinarchaeales archaeon]|jgi:hypothetical protein|nr:DUF2304 family protein [Candidatus Undinarchaeales archaeon]MDP7494455.1 DUF2304 family protein [Candidatus Undinarchaeales archaeon]
MAIHPFQLVVVFIAAFMILKSYEKYRLRIFRRWEVWTWGALWSIVIVFALFPDLLQQYTAAVFMFQRPLDALFALSLLVAFTGLNLIFGLFEQQRRDITQMTREIAIFNEKLDETGSSK